MNKSLILPGTPEFTQATLTLPPDWRNVADRGNGVSHVVDLDTGLLRSVDDNQLREYMNSGEYDARMQQIGLSEDWEHEEPSEELEVEFEEVPIEFLEPEDLIDEILIG